MIHNHPYIEYENIVEAARARHAATQAALEAKLWGAATEEQDAAWRVVVKAVILARAVEYRVAKAWADMYAPWPSVEAEMKAAKAEKAEIRASGN